MHNTYLAHHGVKGQKHGVRQWQNKDGSLTPAGRIHYGVGAARKAVGKVGTAIRKKVKPTNAELNIQIRKEKSKILNKQKKEELKRLKKTGQIEDPKKRVGHKKYSEMTDQEIADRIKRLKNEAELATLEASRNMGPGKRMVAEALQKGITTGIQTAVQSGLKKSGETFINRTLGFDEEYNKAQKEASENAAKKAAEDKAAKKEAKKARKEARKEDFRQTMDNIKNETKGYEKRYAANFGYDGKGPKEKTQKAKVYYTWDADDSNDKYRKQTKRFG